MWKKLLEFKNAIGFVVLIVSLTLGFTAYFAKASDLYTMRQEFNDYKTYQRLHYLDQRIAQFEDRRRCFQDKCITKMSDLEWQQFNEIRNERKRLEQTLDDEKK